MTPILREAAAELRRMSSAEAAGWLIEHYPVGSAEWGNAIVLIEHCSFKKKDAFDLATHYLSRLPHVSDRVYRMFAKLLPFDVFLGAIRCFLPSDQAHRDLLAYYLGPTLRDAARSPGDEESIRLFFADALQR